MAMTTAERVAKHRKGKPRHTKHNGLTRLDIEISVEAKTALKQLSVTTGVTIRGALERLLLREFEVTPGVSMARASLNTELLAYLENSKCTRKANDIAVKFFRGDIGLALATLQTLPKSEEIRRLIKVFQGTLRARKMRDGKKAGTKSVAEEAINLTDTLQLVH